MRVAMRERRAERETEGACTAEDLNPSPLCLWSVDCGGRAPQIRGVGTVQRGQLILLLGGVALAAILRWANSNISYLQPYVPYFVLVLAKD
jgi:hypothetical protein